MYRNRQLLFVLFLCLSFSACSESTGKKKVIILGMDGMPYDKVQEMIAAGALPHFAQLAQQGGGLQPLRSTIPPQSPVAWSSFITGQNPGKTNIYDFIARNPKTYMPFLSTSTVAGETEGVTLGNLFLPTKSPKPVLLRKGKPFWNYLEDDGIKTVVIKVPANYPPAKTTGRSLAGMGTPDILGTYGTFTFYTTKPQDSKRETGGRVIKVVEQNYQITTVLTGSPNPFQLDHQPLEQKLSIYLDPENPVARLDVEGEKPVLLQEGEWSDWQQLSFTMIPYLPKSLGSLSTVYKFLLKSVRPYFELYVTPLNIDPANPFLPLSTPEKYVQELEKELGTFYTQGMPEDTWALNEGRLTDEQFLQQVRFIQDEKRKIFFYEFDRFKEGFLFCHFFATDQLAHMFWRYTDKDHPGYQKNKRYEKIIEKTYKEMDNLLGEVMKRSDKNTTIMVISDHGFASFRRTFNLNTWLYQQGYITLLDDWLGSSGEFFDNVDWSKTKAYALGLNCLYLNLKGREGKGIVLPGKEENALKVKLISQLKKVLDPQTGEAVIKEVYDRNIVYTGKYVSQAPDLIVGYNKNYRASWETALGKIPRTLLADNLKPWSGDHCMAVDLVPGILLANKKLTETGYSLLDLAPSVLALFNLAQPADMDGKSLFRRK